MSGCIVVSHFYTLNREEWQLCKGESVSACREASVCKGMCRGGDASDDGVCVSDDGVCGGDVSDDGVCVWS